LLERFWRLGAYMFVSGYGIAGLVAVAWTGFHVGLNDFWGNLSLADQVDWSSPSSLFNQFFPLGYTVLLKAFGADPIVLAHLASVGSAVLLLTVVYQMGARLLGAPWGLLATASLAIHPQVFRYATTPGPDIIVGALLALAFGRVFWADGNDRGHRLSAGAMFGLAALFRYHALVFAAAAIAATAYGHPRPVRHLRLAIGGMLGVYAVQMVVAVLAHHGPFHTGQAYIFYKLVHGVNWFEPNAALVPSSAWGVVMGAPRLVAAAYLRELGALWVLPCAPALLALAPVREPVRRFARVALMITMAYLLVIASGGSSRGSLPVRFLVALSAVGLVSEGLAAARAPLDRKSRRLVTRGPWRAVALVAFGFWGLLCLRDDFGIIKYRALDNAAYRRVQALLEGDGVRSSNQVFSSDFSLYFPSLPGYIPRTNGTWLRVDGGRYAERFPDLCVTSAECFRQDARRWGVTHVVLTPDARRLSGELGSVYDGTGHSGFELHGRESAFAIFRIR
jgi:hypothetical protein